ncbi:MAG: hypothetical protein NTZ79_09290 [Proteobacteria bacterium]|nr:hypothetical protein [Pseudomonadota bacterium]
MAASGERDGAARAPQAGAVGAGEVAECDQPVGRAVRYDQVANHLVRQDGLVDYGGLDMVDRVAGVGGGLCITEEHVVEQRMWAQLRRHGGPEDRSERGGVQQQLGDQTPRH